MNMEEQFPELQTLTYWIQERERIRIRRLHEMPKPWTDDPILQAYRFCNVHREDDKVTKWIRNNWGMWGHHPNYTLGMALARFINWPETLEEIGFPQAWDPNLVKSIMKLREDKGKKVWTSAYIVSTNGITMPKTRYIVDHVLDPIAHTYYSPSVGDTLQKASLSLIGFNGVSNFMAGQLIADLKNTEKHPLASAPDFKTWCVSGPGSLRGLNRLQKLRPEKPTQEHVFRAHVNELCTYVKRHYLIDIDAQDMQNCLCEFDKYVRTRNKEGRPRQKYPGLL